MSLFLNILDDVFSTTEVFQSDMRELNDDFVLYFLTFLVLKSFFIFLVIFNYFKQHQEFIRFSIPVLH